MRYGPAGEARYDRWVRAMGGYAGERYGALHAEAREFAGPDGYWAYLDMARQVDEEHAAGAGRWLARAVELANARAAARRADSAAAAVLRRAGELRGNLRDTSIRLAADGPRPDGPDFSTRPGMTPAEITAELRARMGLGTRPPSAYETTLPPVSDLARALGLRS